MSDSTPFGFGRFVPGFDFLQNLAKGATIAVRYCAARRQTRAEGAARETQVLDYCVVPMHLYV